VCPKGASGWSMAPRVPPARKLAVRPSCRLCGTLPARPVRCTLGRPGFLAGAAQPPDEPTYELDCGGALP
jgi:hypothetical protein